MTTLLNSARGVGMSGWAGRVRRGWLGGLLGALLRPRPWVASPPPPPPPPRCVRLASLLCALLGTSGLAQAACDGTALGIADACVWLRADTGVSASRDWADQSGMSNTATVNDTTAMTTLNFNPAVSYSGGAGHTFAPTADVTNRYTFLGVARMANLNNTGPVFADDLGASLFGIDGGYQDRWRSGSSIDNLEGEYHRNSVSLTPSMHTLQRDGAAVSLRNNGETIFSTNINFAGAYRMTFAKGGVWGARLHYSNSIIPEFLSFKRPLSDAELARAHSYLALKYGLTLGGLTLGAAQQPYVRGGTISPLIAPLIARVTVWDGGATDYRYRVFGLGRDSVTTLDQRVAKSQEPGALLTIAAPKNDNSADFTSANNDSSRLALSDGKYLVLGDNNGALDTFSVDALGQRGNRIPRVWRVQAGWPRVNAVFLGFDPTLLPASLATSGYLLVSSDTNFSAATTTRYPLNRVTLGGQDFLTPVIEEGSSTPSAVNMLPGVSYISLGQSSPQVCTGSAMGIANACAWYRADQGLGAGSNWPDQSGAGNTAIVNGSPSLTPNSVNFNATVDYRGGAGHTLPVAADVTNQYTFLGLARMTGTHNGRAFSDQLNNRLFGYWGLLGSDARQDVWWDSDGYADESGPSNHSFYFPAIAPQTRPMLYTLQRDANRASRFKSNGRTLSTISMNSTGKYRVALANGSLNGDPADVSIPEFFSFKRALSDAEIDRIESYLALKYGVTLGSAAEPKNYVNSKNQAVWTANSGYQNRVFGLGRDNHAIPNNSTTLDQRVSKSTDHTLDDTRSSILTIATSADFTSANGGTRRQLEPGQYLVLGDNNGDVATLGAATAEQFGRRIGRVWRAQNTGGVGAVYLGFDPTLLETNFPQDKRGFLLVSTDADFSVANTTRYALGRVKVGGKYVFTPVADIGSATPVPVTIPNGSYITLGQESVCTGTALGIADACLWLKANDDGLTPGGTVSTWPDRSGSQKNLTGVGGPSVVAASNTTGMNFNPVVRFNGVDQSMWRNESTIGTDVSEVNIFFAMRETVRESPIARTLLSHFTPHTVNDFRWLIRWSWGSDDKLVWLRGQWDEPRHRNLSSAPFAVGVSNLGLVTNSESSDTATIVVNAKTLNDENPPSPGIRTTTTGLSSTRIGISMRSYETHLHGDIPEFLEFKRDLDATQRTRVQSYLALKYGLTLDRDGLAGNAYTSGGDKAVYSDSGYWHSIIGLGRDELTTLDQRVSRSTQKIGPERGTNGLPTFQLVKGDSPLTIATSADFTSANPGGRQELGDGQYLVLGDNDGALDALSASAMGRNNNRLPRVWRAQTTGVGSVFLGLDAATTLPDSDSRYPRYPRYLFVESGAGADGSFPADRTHAYALSNLGGYWVPVAVGAPLAVNIPNDGAYLSYGVRPVPILALTVQSRGGTGEFRFSGNRGFVASSVTTTAEMQPRSTPGQWLSDGGDLVINVTMPTATGWSLEAASCIDRRAAASDNPSGNPSGAVLGRVSAGNQFTIPASQLPPAADLHCALVARYDSGSTLKTVSGRVFVDNGVGGGGVANDGKINGAETGRSGAALSLTNCGSGGTTIYAYTSSSGDGRYSLKVPPTVTNGPMCIAQTLIDDYRVTQGGLDASGADASGVTLDTTAAQRNRWRFNYAGADVQNLHIGNVPSSRLLVDGTRVGIAGSTVDFPHRLIAGTAGTLAFGVSDASPAASGWSEVLYRDFNCNAQLDAGEPLLGGSPTVAANENVCVIVRQFVPAGLYEGATRQFQLQATLNWANAASRSETLTNRDHTQVSGQALRLYKEVRNVTADERSGTGRESWTTSNSAKPGETLEYRTTFTNLAPEPITKLEIYDATPNYTTLVSAECPAPLSLPAGLTCEPLSSAASPPTKPIDGGTGPLRWRFNGPLPGGTSGAVKYRVKVNE